MIEIRLAGPADNDALLALTKRCPMVADISLRIDRDPDFFALDRARGVSRVWVAMDGDAAVGSVGLSMRPAWIGGERHEIGIIADLKVAPEVRRSGLGQRLLDTVAEAEKDAPPALYLGMTAAGNEAVDGLVIRFGDAYPSRRVGTFVALQLLPVWSLGVRGYDLGAATPSDLAEMAALMDGFYREFHFSPMFGEGGFAELIAASPGASIADYLVARRDGRIVAALGVYDAHAMKSTHVLTMPLGLRTLSATLRTASRVLPVPRLPQPGAELVFRYLRHPAHLPGEEGALRALIRRAVNDAGARRDHFALFAAKAGDPLLALCSGIPSTSYRYAMSVGANRAGAPAIDTLVGGRQYEDACLA